MTYLNLATRVVVLVVCLLTAAVTIWDTVVLARGDSDSTISEAVRVLCAPTNGLAQWLALGIGLALWLHVFYGNAGGLTK